ncbi:hypothetical protein AYX15_00003 [Cryptococcus neoformans]|nr:hypothetical protein AYX15_00003 [Cryptococcus neoformans var. grubii]
MFSIPPSVRRLVFLFLVAAPLLSIVLPVAAAPAGVDPPSKLQPRAPQPSRRMGATKRSKKIEPLKKKDYSSFLCPGGSVACPIPGDEVSPSSVEALEKSLNSLADWFKVGFECVELETELNSCGGCLALGSGQDCALIENARTTGCENGSCQVYSCFDGYVVSPDRTSCVKRGSTIPATPVTAVNVEEFVADGQLPFGQ